MNYSTLNERQLDALQELSNIGMGHAATALSQLIGDSVLIRVPRVTVTDLSQVPELLGGAEKVVSGITLQILGDARGTILLIFPQECSRQLVERLLQTDLPEEGAFDEIAASTLKEVGNILASAYLSALGNLLNMTLIPSIPMLSHDMTGAIVDYLLSELAEEGDLALMMEAEFYDRSGKSESLGGHFFLLPDPKSLQVLLEAVGVSP